MERCIIVIIYAKRWVVRVWTSASSPRVAMWRWRKITCRLRFSHSVQNSVDQFLHILLPTPSSSNACSWKLTYLQQPTPSQPAKGRKPIFHNGCMLRTFGRGAWTYWAVLMLSEAVITLGRVKRSFCFFSRWTSSPSFPVKVSFSRRRSRIVVNLTATFAAEWSQSVVDHIVCRRLNCRHRHYCSDTTVHRHCDPPLRPSSSSNPYQQHTCGSG